MHDNRFFMLLSTVSGLEQTCRNAAISQGAVWQCGGLCSTLAAMSKKLQKVIISAQKFLAGLRTLPQFPEIQSRQEAKLSKSVDATPSIPTSKSTSMRLWTQASGRFQVRNHGKQYVCRQSIVLARTGLRCTRALLQQLE